MAAAFANAVTLGGSPGLEAALAATGVDVVRVNATRFMS